MASPSAIAMPSALASNARERPRGESAVVFEKHVYAKASLMGSTPPAIARSAVPLVSSWLAR